MSDAEQPTGDARAIRVVLVGQDEAFRSRARALLHQESDVDLVGEAVEGTAAMLICIFGDPDVVVVDALMSWQEASAVVARIQESRPAASIVACCARSSLELVAAPLTPASALADGPWGRLPTIIRRFGRPPVSRAPHT